MNNTYDIKYIYMGTVGQDDIYISSRRVIADERLLSYLFKLLFWAHMYVELIKADSP